MNQQTSRTAAQDKLRALLESRGIRKSQNLQSAIVSQGAAPEQFRTSNVPLASTEVAEPKKELTLADLNTEQLQAVELAKSGKEFCLIGGAGKGKTTTLRFIVDYLLKSRGIDPQNPQDENKIQIVCYTRRASRNAAKALAPIGADVFCRTAHKALCYQPEYFDYMDEDGNMKTTMRFIPTITEMNPDRSCLLVVIDEASMLGYETLYKELRDAFPNAIFIFVGDLFQIKPVFGDGVLGHALYRYPVIELKQVYRQAMDSPIVAFQYNWTLAGKLPGDSDLAKISETCTPERGLEFVPFKMEHTDGEVLSQGVANYMSRMYEQGIYDPEQDTILIPFNKSFGSTAINWHLAEYFGQRRGAEVWEVIGLRGTKYLAVGDFVMYEKAECTIIDIKPNPKYWGRPPQEPSVNMLRSGIIKGSATEAILTKDNHSDFVPMDFEDLLNQDAAKEASQAMSAIVTIRDNETGADTILSSSGELSALDFGYCMTIHKAQGSEWRKVWLIMHKTHAVMLNRELLYTGMTRAKDRLAVIYSKQTRIGRKDNSICKAIKKQSIPGDTWQEKARYFADKGK